MHRLLRRRPALFACLFGACIGFVYFLLVYGPHVLDVTNVTWIWRGSDLSQHYLGWAFFRESDWMLPIGMTDRITYPYPVSISFTDSIPLFAFIFKLFAPVLPQTFQYLGLFACMSHMLVGALGALLVWRITVRLPMAVLGGALFVLTPVLMHRTLDHTALGGQWLLLLPMVFWAYENRWPMLWQRLCFWCGLLVLCAWVHPYFIPMALVLQVAWAVHKVFWGCDGRRAGRLGRVLLVFFASAGAGLCALWLTGAFGSGVAVQGGGLGGYSFNLNGFINDIEDFSTFWPSLGQGPLQGEGYAYLGLGVLLLCGGAGLLAVWCFAKRARCGGFGAGLRGAVQAVPGWMWCAAGACVVCIVLALGPVVMWGERVLFAIPYPRVYYSLMGIFRCTGRLVWPVCYLAPLGAIWVLNRLGAKRLLAVLLAVGVCIQGAELTRGYARKRQELRVQIGGQFPYGDKGWAALAASGVAHIVVEEFDRDVGYDFAWYAAQSGMTINKASLARVLDEVNDTARRYCAEIAQGALRADTALVCPADSGWAVGLPLTVAGLYIYEFDGWAVILAQPLEGYDGLPTAGGGLAGGLDALHDLPVTLYLAEWLDGGGGVEIGYTGDVRGQCLPLPAGAYRVTFAGEGLVEGNCRVYSPFLGGDLATSVCALEDGLVMDFTLDEAVPDLELWVENALEVPVLLTGILVEQMV